jgi:hypothetical protein
MPSHVTHKLLKRLGHPEVLQLLTEDLSGTELNTLLLDVVREKAQKISGPGLLQQYRLNRFVKPSDLPVLELKKAEVELLKLFQSHLFEPVELSPVSVLGSCSAVATVDQNKILSALRGTEVLADATNAMALHICDLKKRRVWTPRTKSEKFRLSTIQRHVRTQTIAGAGFTPHFKIGCFVTSGVDTGDFTFEKEALLEHLQLMHAIYKGFYEVKALNFRFLCRSGYADSLRLVNDARDYVLRHAPELNIKVFEKPEKEIDYYKGLQYKTDIQWNDKTFEIADGGFVDWTQQILQNKKERLLIGGIGFEFMFRIMNDML